jgi:uncharacterized protein YkwD
LLGCLPVPSTPRTFDSPLAMRAYVPVANYQTCLSSVWAERWAQLLTTDIRQKHPSLTCHPALVKTAQMRVESMARRGYFAHCDPDGICPNEIATANGCNHGYGNGNYIESILGGPNNVDVGYLILTNSPSHAKHLFGLNDFYKQQRHYGIAIIEWPGSPYGFYYAVEIATCK